MKRVWDEGVVAAVRGAQSCPRDAGASGGGEVPPNEGADGHDADICADDEIPAKLCTCEKLQSQSLVWLEVHVLHA